MNDPLPPALVTYIAGLKARDVGMIGATLANEVQFITPVKTMDKPAILEFLAALYRGFPDWNYDHDEPELLEDGSFAVLWRQDGTHTGTLSFPDFDTVNESKLDSLNP